METSIADLQRDIEERFGVKSYYLGELGYELPEGKLWYWRHAHFFRLVDHPEWRYCVATEAEERAGHFEFKLVNQVPEFAYGDFEDKLHSLSAYAFQRFVADLLRDSDRYSDVVEEVRIRDMHFDIAAIERERPSEQRRKVLFEVKQVRTGSSNLVQQVDRLRHILLDSGDGVSLVLVIAGHLSNEADAAAKKAGLIVWTIEDLVELLLGAPEVENRYFASPPKELSRPSFWAAGISDRTLSEKKGKALLESLRAVSPGKEEWPKYQQLVAEIVEYLFVPPLGPMHYESEDRAGRNRRDLIVENWATQGFWAQMRDVYDARLIVIDAKNSSDQLGKEPVISTAHYLKPYGCGMFGMIFCRIGAGGAAQHALREQWIGGHKMILIVPDKELEKLIQLQMQGGSPEELIRPMIADFLRSL
jgi:hypothetical protein